MGLRVFDLKAIEKMTNVEIREAALATDDQAYFWLLAGYAAGRISAFNLPLANRMMAAGRAWDEERTKELLMELR